MGESGMKASIWGTRCDVTPLDARNQRRFVAWSLAWSVAFVAATLLLGGPVAGNRRPLTFRLATLPPRESTEWEVALSLSGFGWPLVQPALSLPVQVKHFYSVFACFACLGVYLPSFYRKIPIQLGITIRFTAISSFMCFPTSSLSPSRPFSGPNGAACAAVPPLLCVPAAAAGARCPRALPL